MYKLQQLFLLPDYLLYGIISLYGSDKLPIESEITMSEFIICTDSSADLSLDYAKENNIEIVPFYVTLNGTDYLKENVDLSYDDFYNALREGVIPKTSCPSVNDYCEVFKRAVDNGKNVLCICISSKLSGSYQSAYNASLEFNEGEQRVLVIDSLLVAGLQGLLVNEALRMKNNGLDFKAVYDKLNEIKTTGQVDFILDDLTYLQKGGRIGKVSALVGTLLNIKPVIKVKDGELLPTAKIRGRKKAAAEIKKIAGEIYEKYGNTYAYGIINFPQTGDVDGLSETFKEAVPTFFIGSTIGSHVGTSAAGIAYIKRYEG